MHNIRTPRALVALVHATKLSMLLLVVAFMFSCGGGGAGLGSSYGDPSDVPVETAGLRQGERPSGLPPEPPGASLNQLELSDIPDGVNAAVWSQLTGALTDMVATRSGSAHIHAPPTYQISDARVEYDEDERPSLSFTGHASGDYDQNSEVNISDVAVLGRFFGAAIGDHNWTDARVCDGDGNGVINISDLTPIGANFLSRVDWFEVESASTRNGPWSYVGYMMPEDAFFPDGDVLKRFTTDLSSAPQSNFWRVIPVSRGNYGISSNVASSAPDATVAIQQPYVVTLANGVSGHTASATGAKSISTAHDTYPPGYTIVSQADNAVYCVQNVNGNEMTVCDGRLQDAYRYVNVDLDLADAQVIFEPEPGVVFTELDGKSASDVNLGGPAWKASFDVPVGQGININGSLTVENQLTFGMTMGSNWRTGFVDRVQLGNVQRSTLEAVIDINKTITLHREKPLGNVVYYFGPVPGTSIIVEVKMPVVVVLEISSTGGMRIGPKVTCNLNSSLDYKPSTGWLSRSDKSITCTPGITGELYCEASAEVAVATRLSVKLLGAVGPYAEMRLPYGRFSVERKIGSEDSWQAKFVGGMRLSLGSDDNIPFIDLPKYGPVTLFDLNVGFYSATWTKPGSGDGGGGGGGGGDGDNTPLQSPRNPLVSKGDDSPNYWNAINIYWQAPLTGPVPSGYMIQREWAGGNPDPNAAATFGPCNLGPADVKNGGSIDHNVQIGTLYRYSIASVYGSQISEYKMAPEPGWAFDPSTLTYKMSGYIRDDSGNGIPAVRVDCNNGGGSQVTGNDGRFEFTLFAGTYILTPHSESHSFSPATRSVTIAGSDVGNQNFTGSGNSYSVSGYVRNTGGSAMPGVLMQCSNGTSRTTDSSGRYSFTLGNGTVTLTPNYSGHTFSPTSRSVNISGSDVNVGDFTGSANAYTVSGVVRNSGGGGLGGVTVQCSNGTTRTTDGNGGYSFSLADGTYNFTPSYSGHTFSPTSRTATVSGSNISLGDFTGTANAYTVSGFVRNSNGNGIAGVTVNCSNGTSATTNGSGQYSLNLSNGTFTLTPSLTGFSFSPASRTVTVSGSNMNVADFTGSQNTYTASGYAKTSGGAAISGATVTIDNGGGTATTNSSGYWSKSGLVNSPYNASISKSGWGFNPGEHDFTISGNNVSVPDFIGSQNTYMASGYAKTSSGAAISGATVTIDNGDGTATTNGSGFWAKSGLANGLYNASISKSGWGFNPGEHDFTISGNNVSVPDFIGSQNTYTASGYAKTSGGSAISGATVTINNGGGTATTNSSGYWSKSGLANGSYNASISKTGWNFNPDDHDFTVSGGNVSVPNFIGSQNNQTSVWFGNLSSGSIVSFDMKIAVYAIDADLVKFYVDGVLRNTQTQPYKDDTYYLWGGSSETSWNIAGESNGTHTIKVVAENDSGGYVEDIISVTVVNGANTSGTYKADQTYQSTSLLTVPKGSTQYVYVTMKNLGTATWRNYGPAPVRLATTLHNGAFDNPIDYAGDWFTPEYLKHNRVQVVGGNGSYQDYGPNAEVQFAIPIHVPTWKASGTYQLNWNLVADGLQWIHDLNGVQHGNYFVTVIVP